VSRRSHIAAVLLTLLVSTGCRKGPDFGQKWPDPDRKIVASARASVDIGQAKHVEESNLGPLDSDWEALVKPGRRARVGVRFELPDGVFLDILERLADGTRVVRFSRTIGWGTRPRSPRFVRPSWRERRQHPSFVRRGSVAVSGSSNLTLLTCSLK